MLTEAELLALPSRPLEDDGWPTPTSTEEAEVEEDILDTLAPVLDAAATGSSKKIKLDRRKHIAFLNKILSKSLPAAYVPYDASRPWLLYWSLHTFTLLGHSVDANLKARSVSTLLSCQNRQLGGFGGGPGQIPHLMSSYAAINALAMAGSPGPQPTAAEYADIAAGKTTMEKLGKGGWDDLDREKLYAWLLRLKQPDGSFTVHEGGEVDVRASYCVWCIAALTGIMTHELLSGMPGFLASCQSYEGGLSSSSFPTYSADLSLDPSAHRPALGEAHGGYAFCASAAFLGLQLLDSRLYPQAEGASTFRPPEQDAAQLDLDSLTRWTLGLQCPFPSQGGGFKGRINKLVDGCYSWFSGAGMWGIIESLRSLQRGFDGSKSTGDADADADLWSRESLQLYILLVAQNLESGGLRDKPGKKPDAYHTCYNLSGLSAAQHVVRPCRETRRFCYEGWETQASHEGGDIRKARNADEEELRRRIYASTLGYNLGPGREKMVVGDKGNEVLPTHPILNVGFLQVRAMLLWAYGQ